MNGDFQAPNEPGQKDSGEKFALADFQTRLVLTAPFIAVIRRLKQIPYPSHYFRVSWLQERDTKKELRRRRRGKGKRVFHAFQVLPKLTLFIVREVESVLSRV